MHNNFYFLRQLSHSLEKVLKGTVVSECFSQSKDELLIRFETHSDPYYIKVTALPHFSCLSFPDKFQRARKNSVDLFEQLVGQRVLGIMQFENERSFALSLSSNMSLLFKMHGNRTNVILFKEDSIIELFRKNIIADGSLSLQSLHRQVDWSREAFDRHIGDLQKLYFTFGKPVWQYLANRGFAAADDDRKWDLVQAVRTELEDPRYFISRNENLPSFLLLDPGDASKVWTEPIAAINDFYYTFNQVFFAREEKAGLLSLIKAKLQGSRNFVVKNREKLQELEEGTSYRVWADLIMANLHAIPANRDRVTLENFYHENHPVEIKLKKGLTPQKNAEVYYRKAKNQQIEVDRLSDALRSKEGEIARLSDDLLQLEQSDDLKVIRKISSAWKADGEPQRQKIALPYHEFVVNGFRIWVGKNAEDNDVLTLKHGYKEDLWLHAKDVAGSHVLIKHQAGKKFPKDVIERAAQLAAYNSKRKNETLCPVVVTPKKFIRKRKGDPAGMVVVEREEVILVEPKL